MKAIKKIFLWFGLPLILVIAILALFGKQWVWGYLSPPKAFVLSDAPAPPDYTDDYFWIAHPEKKDTSDLIPTGLDTSNDLTDKPVDVFYIHPTGYFGPGGWNSTMGPEKSEAQSIETMLAGNVSMFNGCCSIYGPHYREAHLQAFFPEPETFEAGTQALDLAYTDVKQAFEYYLEHFNQGRPFMIVAHSQGTAHALRLLEQEIDQTPLYKQMVAAYIVGYWLPMDKFERGFKQIKACVSAEQTGCIVSFDTYGQGGTPDAKMPHWYATGWEPSREGEEPNKVTLCVNPLNWQTNLQNMPKEQHLGALPMKLNRSPLDILFSNNPGFVYESLPPLTNELTWAQCQKDGRLEVEEQKDNAFSNHSDQPNKSYHLFDYSLFYGNIRHNAIMRVKHYQLNTATDQSR